MPAVSIVMPAYNAAPFIEAAIDSALRQTFTDIEVLVVDDGSTDDTAAIVERMAARDARVRFLRQPNSGVSVARNAALRVARGEFFSLLDSDDLYAPDFLAEQLAIFAARPEVDIVTTNGWYLGGPNDGQLARRSPDPRPVPDLASIIGDETAVFIMSVVRRRVYTTIGSFDESICGNEDYDFWLRAAVAGFTFARNDRPLGHYRVRSDSLSACDVRMLNGILKVYRKLRPMIAGRPYETSILERQIARFETDLIAAEARAAIESGDYRSAAKHLDALGLRRPSTSLAVARGLARWTPGLLAWLYRTRRAHLARMAHRRMAS
jgi:glycosyltransferase involved in cell wall biosynthesis